MNQRLRDIAPVRAILVGSPFAIAASERLDAYALATSIFAPLAVGVLAYETSIAGGYLWFLVALRREAAERR